MYFLFTFILSLIASTHVACYGAFKDTPFEGFRQRRVLRELLVTMSIALFFLLFFRQLLSGEKYLIFFLIILIFSRIITEMYKQFVRCEDQSIYKIPSQVHFFRQIVKKRVIRLAFGLVVVIFFGLGLSIAWRIYLLDLPIRIRGLLVGFTAGFLIALGGGYKDGFFEGFNQRKFLRSPLVASLSGAFLADKTTQVSFLFFASMGLERMIVECYKGFFKAGYVPGKFKMRKVIYRDWLVRRRMFIAPYILTWIVFIIMVTYAK